MSIAPTLIGDTIFRGAAHIIIDKPATKTDWQYLFANGEVTVKVVRPKRQIKVSGFGRVAQPIEDEYVTVTFTPSGQKLNQKSLDFLYGGILAAAPGSSWFGATNTPVSIHTKAGRILTLTNCRPTSFVPVTFGAGVGRFGGSVTLTGVLGRGMARTAANALWTPWADESFDAEPDASDYQSYACAASWAAIAGLTMESMEAWNLSIKCQLQPIKPTNIGTVDFWVPEDGPELEISGKPANLNESHLWADYVLGSSRQIGTSVAGSDFTIAEDFGGVTAVINGAELIDPANSYSVMNPVAGQCVWAAQCKKDAEGNWTPLGTLTLTPDPAA